MARVKRAVHSKKHRRAVLEEAQGYYGNKSRSYRAAHEQVMHSGLYAFRDRRARKGDFRRLWVQRVNAASRAGGLSYSRFIAGLKAADVSLDRKVLADLAVRDEAAFSKLVDLARDALSSVGASSSDASSTGAPAPPGPASTAGPSEDTGPSVAASPTSDEPVVDEPALAAAEPSSGGDPANV
jgi:large subunit ribosomal protein L20